MTSCIWRKYRANIKKKITRWDNYYKEMKTKKMIRFWNTRSWGFLKYRLPAKHVQNTRSRCRGLKQEPWPLTSHLRATGEKNKNKIKDIDCSTNLLHLQDAVKDDHDCLKKIFFLFSFSWHKKINRFIKMRYLFFLWQGYRRQNKCTVTGLKAIRDWLFENKCNRV